LSDGDDDLPGDNSKYEAPGQILTANEVVDYEKQQLLSDESDVRNQIRDLQIKLGLPVTVVECELQEPAPVARKFKRGKKSRTTKSGRAAIKANYEVEKAERRARKDAVRKSDNKWSKGNQSLATTNGNSKHDDTESTINGKGKKRVADEMGDDETQERPIKKGSGTPWHTQLCLR
jgi:hypothetical protein